MLQDPEFLEALNRARAEILDKLGSELCRHGERAFDDEGHPSPCSRCRQAAAERSASFWEGAKAYQNGVKPLEEEEARPRPTTFVETPGFAEPPRPLMDDPGRGRTATKGGARE